MGLNTFRDFFRGTKLNQSVRQFRARNTLSFAFTYVGLLRPKIE